MSQDQQAPARPEMRIDWVEVSAETMVGYFVKGYTSAASIQHHVFFYDAASRTFILKLYVQQ